MYIYSSYTTSVRSSYQRIHTPFMPASNLGSCELGMMWVVSTR